MKTTIGILLSLRFFQSASAEPKTSQIEGRIIGGSDAPKDAYPWFAKALETYYQPELTTFCGGMLVAPDWILTAAHCTVYMPDDAIMFQIGALSNSTDGDNGGQYSETISAEYTVEHPDYNITDFYDNSNDFALVKLKGHSTITPVDMDLTGISNSYDSDKELWTLGFGAMENYTSPDWLQHVDVSFVSQEMCENNYAGLYNVTDKMMCAAAPDKDSCSGDSGGPLYDKENDKVVGVVSWGEGCADPLYPGVYAKISSQAEWIQKTICSDTDVDDLLFCEGYTNAPTVSKEPTISPTVSSVPTIECDDVPGWVDSYGVGCDWYNTEGNCELYGSIDAGPSGLTANDACCKCGGGVGNYPTAAPTVSNAPTVTCEDLPYWVDFSNARGCRDYDSDYMCLYHGGYSGTSGLTAYDACCNCGGGIGTYPTSAPTVACVDVPNWVDEHGSSCDDVYVTDTMCDLFGDIYEGTSGLTANDACCKCGGGVGNYPTVTPTCKDVIDWVDSNNLGCDAYTSDEVCEFFGDKYEGTNGLTANEACCKCGGGLTPTLSPVAQTDVKQSKSSKSSKSSLKSSKSNTKSSKASKSSKSTKASKSGKAV